MRTRTAALVYLLLGLAVFGRALVPGQLFVPMHTQRLEPWRSDLTPEKSAELAAGEYTAPSDKLISFRADDEITVDALRHGRLPLWNPTNAGGVPHLAQGLYGVFYPPHWLYLLLGPQHAYSWLALLHHVLAALFMFMWLRKLGTGDAGALIGGLAFSFSGTLLDRAHYYQYIETVTWLPLGLLCIEHWFEGRRAALFALAPLSALTLLVAWPQLASFVLNAWAITVLVKSLHIDLRTTARHVCGSVLVAIAIATATVPFLPSALIALGLWPHVALLVTLAVGPGRKAAMPEGARPRRDFLVRLGKLGAVFALGAAIAAIQYLPAAEWTEMGSRQMGGAPEAQCGAALRSWYALAAIMPDMFGTPSWPLLNTIFNLPRMYGLNSPAEVLLAGGHGNLLENALYVGIAPLALALLGLFGARGRRGPLLAALVIFGGIALGAPAIVYPAYFLFPGFQISPDARRALVLVAPFMAAFAAFGVRMLSERPRMCRAMASFCVALGIALLVTRWTATDATLLGPLLAHTRDLAEQFHISGDVPAHAQTEVLALLRQSLESAGLVAALSGIAMWFAIGFASEARRRMLPLLLVVAADLIVHAWPRTASQPAAGFLGSHPLIEHLRDSVGHDGRLARFVGTDKDPRDLLSVAFPPNLAGVHGLVDAWCYTVSLPKAWTALATVGFEPNITVDVGFVALNDTKQLASRALDVMGVKAIVCMGEPPAELPPGIVLDGRFGHAYVLKNERALPRATFVATATPFDAASDWAACAHAVLETVETERPLRLGSPAAPVREVPAMTDVEGAMPNTTVIDETPERVVVRLEGGTRDGWLLLRDGFARGWKARIDGADAPVVPGDLAFRAVLVPAGAHEVVFSYEPTSVAIGKVVSLGALGIALILLVLARRRDTIASAAMASAPYKDLGESTR